MGIRVYTAGRSGERQSCQSWREVQRRAQGQLVWDFKAKIKSLDLILNALEATGRL